MGCVLTLIFPMVVRFVYIFASGFACGLELFMVSFPLFYSDTLMHA